jgi:hypothetical protein
MESLAACSVPSSGASEADAGLIFQAASATKDRVPADSAGKIGRGRKKWFGMTSRKKMGTFRNERVRRAKSPWVEESFVESLSPSARRSA